MCIVPEDQIEDVRETQTFLVTYTHSFDKIKELEFLTKLREIKLGYHKDIVTYLGEEMFRLIIYDSEVDINNFLRLLN